MGSLIWQFAAFHAFIIAAPPTLTSDTISRQFHVSISANKRVCSPATVLFLVRISIFPLIVIAVIERWFPNESGNTEKEGHSK